MVYNVSTSHISCLWKYYKIQSFCMYKNNVQAFLNFHGFDIHDFQFTAIYNSILFFSPLVLLSKLDLQGFRFPHLFMCPLNNSVNRGIPVLSSEKHNIYFVMLRIWWQKGFAHWIYNFALFQCSLSSIFYTCWLDFQTLSKVIHPRY